jgi:hypothetical protein
MPVKFAQRGEAELCNLTSLLMMRYHTCIVQGDSRFTARAKTHTSNPFKILKKCRNDCVAL